jgi:hypothetical protein
MREVRSVNQNRRKARSLRPPMQACGSMIDAKASPALQTGCATSWRMVFPSGKTVLHGPATPPHESATDLSAGRTINRKAAADAIPLSVSSSAADAFLPTHAVK